MSDVGHPAPTKAQALIGICLDAYKACQLAAAYGANEGGELAEPHLLQRLYDSADLTLALANLLARASHFHRPLAALCADAAEACAEALRGREEEPLQNAREACAAVQEGCAALPQSQEPA